MPQLDPGERNDLFELLDAHIHALEALDGALTYSELPKSNKCASQSDSLPTTLGKVLDKLNLQYKVVGFVEGVLHSPDSLGGSCPPIENWLDTNRDKLIERAKRWAERNADITPRVEPDPPPGPAVVPGQRPGIHLGCTLTLLCLLVASTFVVLQGGPPFNSVWFHFSKTSKVLKAQLVERPDATLDLDVRFDNQGNRQVDLRSWQFLVERSVAVMPFVLEGQAATNPNANLALIVYSRPDGEPDVEIKNLGPGLSVAPHTPSQFLINVRSETRTPWETVLQGTVEAIFEDGRTASTEPMTITARSREGIWSPSLVDARFFSDPNLDKSEIERRREALVHNKQALPTLLKMQRSGAKTTDRFKRILESIQAAPNPETLKPLEETFPPTKTNDSQKLNEDLKAALIPLLRDVSLKQSFEERQKEELPVKIGPLDEKIVTYWWLNISGNAKVAEPDKTTVDVKLTEPSDQQLTAEVSISIPLSGHIDSKALDGDRKVTIVSASSDFQTTLFATARGKLTLMRDKSSKVQQAVLDGFKVEFRDTRFSNTIADKLRGPIQSYINNKLRPEAEKMMGKLNDSLQKEFEKHGVSVPGNTPSDSKP